MFFIILETNDILLIEYLIPLLNPEVKNQLMLNLFDQIGPLYDVKLGRFRVLNEANLTFLMLPKGCTQVTV